MTTKETAVSKAVQLAIAAGHSLFTANFDAALVGVRAMDTRMVETLCAIVEVDGGHVEAQAKADAYKADSDAAVTKYDDENTAEYRAARMTAQWASKMNRVIRGTFEDFTYRDEKNVEKKWAPLGVEKAVGILKGKGTLPEKLVKFGSTGRGPKVGKADVMLHLRKVATGKETVIHGVESLGVALAAASSVVRGPKKLEGAKLESALLVSLVAAIKSAPESIVGNVIEAAISRGFQSETFRDMAVGMSNVWKNSANAASQAIDKAKAKEKGSTKAKGIAAPLATPATEARAKG